MSCKASGRACGRVGGGELCKVRMLKARPILLLWLTSRSALSELTLLGTVTTPLVLEVTYVIGDERRRTSREVNGFRTYATSSFSGYLCYDIFIAFILRRCIIDNASRA